jgi:hypothetical protein
MNNRIAVLVTGLLRNIELTLDWFNGLPDNVDVFIVTNDKYRQELLKFNNLKSSFIIEDCIFQKDLETQLLKKPEGSKILQWQKFKLGMLKIKEEQDKSKFKYSTVYKVRSDLESLDIDIIEVKGQVIKMNTDLVFAGSFNVMMKLSDFYLDSLLNYYNRSDEYFVLDFDVIAEANLSAGKFEWLKFPKSIFKELRKVDDIKQIIKNNQSKLKKIGSIKNQDIVCLRENYKSIIYPSEVIFLHFVMSLKLKILPISPNIALNKSRLLNEQGIESYVKNIIRFDDLSLYPELLSQPVKIRDIAIFLESKNLSLALELMEFAHQIAPERLYIRQKMLEYRQKLLLIK